MKLILNNFLNILKCYKQSSIFNILGLSFAFVACYLIFIQANYDFSFGKVHKDYQNIYRVNMQINDKKGVVGAPIVKELLDKSSNVVNSSLLDGFGYANPFAEVDDQRIALEIEILEIDSNLNKVIAFDMVVGEYSSIGNPDALLIPLSVAENLYGSAENAIGKRFFTSFESKKPHEIVAVYRDFSELTMLKNRIYRHYDIDYSKAFKGFSGTIYFKVVDETNMEELANKLTADMNEALSDKMQGATLRVFFTSLDNIYFEKDVQFANHATGNIVISFTLILVALLIMIIAIINFVNFSIALAPRRIKAINTYRILGHSLGGLRFMLIFEAVFISLVSFLLSIGFIQLISATTFANVFSSSVMIMDNISTLVMMSVFALIIGIIAGIYPAFHITNFSPALVLNGGKSLPKSALFVRQILISFQYVISITMIIISVFINLQNNFMMNMDYGYDTENLLEVAKPANSRIIKAQLLEKYSFIEDIAFAANSIISGNDYSINNDSDEVFYDFCNVSYNYPKLMGLEIIEGEDFVEADMDMKENLYALLNETAKNDMKVEIGDKIESLGIVVKGIFKDVNHKSLHSATSPLVLPVGTWTRYMYVKYVGDQNVGNVIEAVRSVIAENNNGEIAEISTADQVRYETYKKDANLNTIISWAAMLAILISIVGVIGLVSLESQHRIREIALRKVHGATTGEILQMFNVKFIKIVAVCYVISVPLAWYVVNQWLMSFEYRVPMSLWVFIVAGLFIAGLTIFIVTAQSYKAATTNPAQAMNN